MPKPKYETHIKPKLDLIISWRQAGKTEEQIAEKLNVACSTLREHKRLQPDLMAALNTSKERLVANLKKSLWEEAIGYEYEEVTEHMEVIVDKDGKENVGKRKVKRTKVKKRARGVPTLLIFALCNWAPKEFKRVDKEAIEELKQTLEKTFNDDRILNAFNALYEKKEKKNNNNDKTKNS